MEGNSGENIWLDDVAFKVPSNIEILPFWNGDCEHQIAVCLEWEMRTRKQWYRLVFFEDGYH